MVLHLPHCRGLPALRTHKLVSIEFAETLKPKDFPVSAFYDLGEREARHSSGFGNRRRVLVFVTSTLVLFFSRTFDLSRGNYPNRRRSTGSGDLWWLPEI